MTQPARPNPEDDDDDESEDEDLFQMVPDEMDYTHEDSFKYLEMRRQGDEVVQQKLNQSQNTSKGQPEK